MRRGPQRLPCVRSLPYSVVAVSGCGSGRGKKRGHCPSIKWCPRDPKSDQDLVLPLVPASGEQPLNELFHVGVGELVVGVVAGELAGHLALAVVYEDGGDALQVQ